MTMWLWSKDIKALRCVREPRVMVRQVNFFLLFFVVLGLDLRTYYTLSPTAGHFLWRVFPRQELANYFLGWLQIVVLLISASWVAKITGMRHCCPARQVNFVFKNCCSW
jgi:hypothetical protein